MSDDDERVSASVSPEVAGSSSEIKHNQRQKVLDAAVSIYMNNDDLSSGGSSVDFDEIRQQAKKIVKSLYGDINQTPTVQDLVSSILNQASKETTVWSRGDWVEYRGNDMKWHVAQIRGVVKQAPDSWDWNDPDNYGKEPEYLKFYNVGKETLLPDTHIRATEEGLKAVFGCRPWVWQQYALLQLEKHVRFQRDHERDFMEVDCQKFADDMFHEWLKDERNSEFYELYAKQTTNVQEMLLNHLITPFELFDEITESEEWDFEDADMSIYTYLSILGSGSLFVLFCFVVQLVIPVLLLLNALVQSERFNSHFTSDLVYLDTTWDQFCSGEGSLIGKIMVLAVLSVYVLTVVPGSIVKFYRTTGDAQTTYSKVNSLRQVVWAQGDDTFLQQLGFKLDRYMNTAFVCILYSVMLFILFNTEEVLDIILNALAGEFIHEIDEQVAAAEWYDEGNRWLTAGACQLVLQANIRLRLISNPAAFCKAYDIDPREYSSVLGSTVPSHLPRLKKASLAAKDDNDIEYMSEEDVLFHECAKYSREKGNEDGIKQFEKSVRTFSFLEGFINLFADVKSGVFDNYRQYRTWSRWEKVLFLSRVPEPIESIEDQVPARKAKGFVRNSGSFEKVVRDILRVLTFRQMALDVWSSARKGLKHRVPFHLVDGFFQWLSYCLQLIFPMVVFAGLFFIPLCY